MRPHTRVLVILLLTLLLAAACSRAARGQRVSQAPPPPPTMASTPTESMAPIPGHAPVSMSGVVASFDPATGILTFEDGRMVKVTDQSRVLKPFDASAVRPGEPVVVRNALPIGVRSASATSGGGENRGKGSRSGKRQRMGTVATIDQPNQVVLMTDGTSIRVTPSTKMHMGTAGQGVVLAELRPGDELVIVIAEEGTARTGRDATAAPSALPREAASATPSDASEVMVFRNPQAP